MRIAVTGYASLDYAVRLDSPALPDRTSTILSRTREWPRLGGSPAYVCAALAAGGISDAAPVSWVGDDPDGARYGEALSRLGLATQGVSVRAGRTPVCVLAYQPDGGCLCLYDPGLAAPLTLDEPQRALIGAADALVATVGPAQATRQALASLRAGAKVVWVVKADPRATPPDLAAALAARADIIVHSRAEAAFVAAAGPANAAVRVETRGSQGVAIRAAGRESFVAAEALEVEDTTGAGDTWVGGFLAAHLGRAASPEEAARAGNASVRAMLVARQAETKG